MKFGTTGAKGMNAMGIQQRLRPFLASLREGHESFDVPHLRLSKRQLRAAFAQAASVRGEWLTTVLGEIRVRSVRYIRTLTGQWSAILTLQYVNTAQDNIQPLAFIQGGWLLASQNRTPLSLERPDNELVTAIGKEYPTLKAIWKNQYRLIAPGGRVIFALIVPLVDLAPVTVHLADHDGDLRQQTYNSGELLTAALLQNNQS
ncbi:hypothetical protein [Schleiferilactobacillus perolens]|jgi:hypothetical protein|uniref:Uncharacterized protein n=1 Tax=Schleiferilactobacillus perolens DSM 12744 TaxID=1423792 RepID=A0A0R1MNM7_9LACO|nr:hypothetical protein [Schleiferilactobacillus perolens]KRL09622.1 hypothetical protein FD09_GL001068 [Schleiferilactobacillus perolens DSM 12744]MCI2170999.1 hypothetical protein [Schleiferilactobacillus perolens]